MVDTYDALVTNRGYKRAWTSREACLHLLRGAGREFDPDIVHAFVFKVLKRNFRLERFQTALCRKELAIKNWLHRTIKRRRKIVV